MKTFWLFVLISGSLLLSTASYSEDVDLSDPVVESFHV